MGVYSSGIDILDSAFEFAAIGMVGLVFFSPRSYQRWIVRRRSATKAEKSRIPADLR